MESTYVNMMAKNVFSYPKKQACNQSIYYVNLVDLDKQVEGSFLAKKHFKNDARKEKNAKHQISNINYQI